MYKNYKGLIFGILGAIALMMSIVAFINRELSEQNHANMDLKYHIVADKFQSFQRGQETRIRMIAEHPAVVEYLLNSSPEAQASAEALLYYTAKANENVMQIRLLSPEGMERVRVDRTTENALVKIRGEKLQDKAKRDYFILFKTLPEKKIGYSVLDLNVEHGKVEVPWRPTLRIGMPVFKDAHEVGVVIINFYMNPFLKDIEALGQTRLTLIDSQGYYILHPDPQKAWSFYRNPPFKDTNFYQPWSAQKLDAPFYEGDSNVYPITLFNAEKTLAVFSPKIFPSEQFIRKAFQFTLAGIVALLMVLVPSIWIIRKMIANLHLEKSKLDEQNAFLDAILENAFDAKVIIDDKAIIIRVNKAARILFSYDNNELVGKNVKLLVPEPDLSRHDDYVRNHSGMESKIIANERKLHALDKNGALIPIALAVTPIRLEKKLFFIGVIRDLSQIFELKAQQKEQEIMMRQAKLASMGEMISAISHQWRQPLNSIGLIAQELFYLQEDGELDTATMKQSKNDIMAQLHYMSQTIDDFRQFFSKDKELNDFNAIALIKEVQRLYSPQLKAHTLGVDVVCPNKEKGSGECPDMDHAHYSMYEMRGYPSELKHVLINLLSNAKDAILKLNQSSAQQRQITILMSLKDETMIFEISDLAGGIDKETLSRLFEPYFTTKEMGTGLGLYIAKTITEQFFQGTLEYVDNMQETDKGSAFVLKIPRRIFKNDD
mgnify:CR=1 FL=1